MPLLMLLALALVCMWSEWPTPADWAGLAPDPVLSGLLTWSGVVFLSFVAFAFSRLVGRAIRLHPERREAVLQRYAALRHYYVIGMFAFYAVALVVLGWGWTVQTTFPDLPGSELLLLAPFLTLLVGSWFWFYDADRALHDHGPPAVARRPFWSRGANISFQLRQNLALVMAPLLLMVLQKALPRLFPGGENSRLLSVTALGLMAGVIICLPWLLRLILDARPFPPGPLRDRLLICARRLKFRCSDILLWNTHGGVGNAMVAGILPYPRYVLLTDRLVSELTPEEVEAVFGHEVGHVKHYHMLFYFGFLISSMAAVGLLWELAKENLPLDPEFLKDSDWGLMPLVGLIGAYIFVVFGFLSRRCERQADVYGCRAVSCHDYHCPGHDAKTELVPRGQGLCPSGIRTFIDALEKVARINGVSRSRPGWLQSWQHSTIARRVEFLHGMLQDPTLEPQFQRRVRLVKWGLTLVLVAVLAVLVKVQGWDSFKW